MKILLDTCILAELRKPEGSPAVKAALDLVVSEDLFLSVLTIGEITKGIALLQSGRQKQALAEWLAGLECHFNDRILPLSKEIAIMWGELTARAQTEGITVPACDGLIAATALYHGLHVMTRNVKHFRATGVLILDPVGPV